MADIIMSYFNGVLKIFEQNVKRLITFMLAIVLYVFIASYDGILALKASLHGAKYADYYVEPLLFLFLLIGCFLVISGLCQLLSFSCEVIRSVFALLVKRYQMWRTAYDASQLTICRYANVIAALSLDDKAFLELFSADGVSFQRMVGETLLPHKTYVAHHNLIMKGLIKTDHVYKKRYGPSPIIKTESFALEKDAIPSLRRLFYGGKSPVTEIVLKMDRVAGFVSFGTGAGQCNFRRSS